MTKKSKKHDPDMEFLDQYLKSQKESQKSQTSKNSEQEKTPLAQKLDDISRDDLKKRLHAKQFLTKQMRSMPARKEVEEQQKKLAEMMKHPRMTPEILQLYGKAIEYNPTKTLPTPIEIFDDSNKYKTEYFQYILSIVETFKKAHKDIGLLQKVLDNPYGHYMSKCLGIPLNPFDKHANLSRVVNKEDDTIPDLIDHSEDDEVPELVDNSTLQASESQPEHQPQPETPVTETVSETENKN
jgi:hypothetical protein